MADVGSDSEQPAVGTNPGSTAGMASTGGEARATGSVAGAASRGVASGGATGVGPRIHGTAGGGAATGGDVAGGGEGTSGQDARVGGDDTPPTPEWLQETPVQLLSALGPLADELMACVRQLAAAAAVPTVPGTPKDDSGAGLAPGSHAAASAHRVRRKHGILTALDALVTVRGLNQPAPS